jgi:hypothetical protein
MKLLIRTLFEVNYNCYAGEFSKKNMYGDIIKLTGRLYDEHGSEFWSLFKQVLRPIVTTTNAVVTEGLPGFTNSTVVATSTPTSTETNDVLPPQNITPTTTLSSLFKKNGNKLCAVLPSPLKYK